MIRRLVAALAVAALPAFGGACHHPPVSMAEPRVAPTARDYLSILKRWTRHGHVLYDFDEALTIDATLHGPEFRAAFAEKTIALYKLGPDEAARTRAQLAAEVADVWEIHVESSSHNVDVDNFSPAKRIWRITLLDDRGRSVGATEIKALKDRREVITVLYPYAKVYEGSFTRSWRFRFPKQHADGTPLVGPDTKRLIMRFAGPQGSTDLVWELGPDNR